MHRISVLAIILTSILMLDFGCKPEYKQGKVLYNRYCSNCHGAEGKGLKSLYPSINNSDYLREYADELPCIIRYGLSESIVVNGKTFTTPMAGIPELNEVEITNIVNFIENNWLGKSSFNSLSDVKNKLERCN